MEVSPDEHNHLAENRAAKKAKFMSIVKEKALTTEKDPQEIISDAFRECGLDKSLMADTTARVNIKRNIRKARQVQRNDPDNPRSRDKFEIDPDFKTIKVTRENGEEHIGFVAYDSAIGPDGKIKTDENGVEIKSDGIESRENFPRILLTSYV